MPESSGKERVKLLNQLADLYIHEAAQDSGLQQAQEALQLATSLEYEEGRVRAFYNLGKFHAFQSNFPSAVENYQKSISLASRIDDQKLLVAPYSDLSYIYGELGNYSKALEYALAAVRITDELNQIVGDQSQVYDNISYIYQELGNLKDAKKYALLALKADSLYGDQTDYALGLNNLGEIYKTEGDYAQALELYQRALRIFEGSDNKQALIRFVYSSISEVMIEQKSPDEAIPYLEKSLQLNREYDDTEGLIYDSGLMSQAYLQKKNPEKALQYANLMIEKAEKAGFNDLLRDGYKYAASAYAGLGRFQQAFSHERYHAELSQRLYQENATRQIAEMQTEYELDKKEREIVILNERQKQQEVLINQKNIQTRFLIFSSLLGVALLLVLFMRFRDKQYQNKVLESQKKQIEKQNQNLEKLNAMTNKQKSEIEKQKDNIEAQHQELAKKNKEIQRKQSELQRTYQDLNRSHRELTKAHDELSRTAQALDESNAKLEHSYGQITSSITYAKRIQEAMLPDPEMIRQTFSDFFILYRPRDIVSGDFYWYAEVENKAVVVVADCTGHGVPGAIMSMAGNAYLNQIVLSQRTTNPAQILEKLHQSISAALRQQQTENKDGMDATVCVLDKAGQEIVFAGAKNPLVYLKEGELYYLRGDRTMIGGFTRKSTSREPFQNHVIPIDAPLTLYMYSDGYQDQFGGSQNTKFMSKRFRKLLQNTAGGAMATQKERLEETFVSWRGESKQLDDVLVVGLKISPQDVNNS